MNDTVYLKKVIAFGFLKLVVEYRGNNYAIVRHVRSDGSLMRNTPAAPPYVTKTLTSDWVDEIQKTDLDERVRWLRKNSRDRMLELQERMKALCHQLGFQDFEVFVEPGDSSDYFVSPTSAILGVPVNFELRCTSHKGLPRHVLADAFGRRGFMYVPLKSVLEVDCQLPIYSNVSKMLHEWVNSPSLAVIEDNEFVIQSRGLVCSLDVNGYGGLLHASQGNVISNKNFVQCAIRSEVVRLASRLLWRLGLPPHQMTGDGALFCLPLDGADLGYLCKAYMEEVCKPLDIWNQQILAGESSGTAAGSRLVVVQDVFHCGRIAGAESVATGIDGQALIDVVRLDSGFKEYAKKIDASYDSKHFFVSSDSDLHGKAGLLGTSTEFKYETKEKCKLNGRFTPIFSGLYG